MKKFTLEEIEKKKKHDLLTDAHVLKMYLITDDADFKKSEDYKIIKDNLILIQSRLIDIYSSENFELRASQV
jgi:hypothetical protein